jgi:isopentenyldiphosphate isomerase
MAYPPVIVVDKEDKQRGLAMLAEVWEKGLYHRVVRIMVEDGKGNVLLQKRSNNMVIFPNCWDNSAAGHVDEGMTYHAAALQEVAEELGIAPVGLAEIGYFLSEDTYGDKVMHQFNKVYRLRFEGVVTTKDEHEVSGFQWFSLTQAKQLATEHPDRVTFGLYHVLTKLY